MENDIVLAPSGRQPSRFLEFLKKYGIILINIVLVLVIIVILVTRALRSSTLEILVAPTSATVKINGKQYPTNGTFDFYPGTYQVEISAENFETKQLTLNLEKDSIQKLYTYLSGAGGDLSVYTESPGDLTVLDLVGDDSVQKFLDSYSIKDVLPIFYQSGDANPEEYKEFSISYETKNCKQKSFCLSIVDVFEGNYDLAISLIKEYGYDPSEYEILYEYTCKKGDFETCNRI